MIKPLYKSVPTVRKYEDYVLEAEYTKGWNDAMDYMFPEEKANRDREKIKERIKALNNDS